MAETRDEYNARMRVYMAQRYRERRTWALVLLGGKCVDCGATEALEFDHIDPSIKIMTIGDIWSYAETKFLAEVAKCELRCAPCHRVRTNAQFAVEHGGGKSGKKNCKCVPCKERKREYMRDWKATRKAA